MRFELCCDTCVAGCLASCSNKTWASHLIYIVYFAWQGGCLSLLCGWSDMMRTHINNSKTCWHSILGMYFSVFLEKRNLPAAPLAVLDICFSRSFSAYPGIICLLWMMLPSMQLYPLQTVLMHFRGCAIFGWWLSIFWHIFPSSHITTYELNSVVLTCTTSPQSSRNRDYSSWVSVTGLGPFYFSSVQAYVADEWIRPFPHGVGNNQMSYAAEAFMEQNLFGFLFCPKVGYSHCLGALDCDSEHLGSIPCFATGLLCYFGQVFSSLRFCNPSCGMRMRMLWHLSVKHLRSVDEKDSIRAQH